jgi:hypothetical protein
MYEPTLGPDTSPLALHRRGCLRERHVIERHGVSAFGTFVAMARTLLRSPPQLPWPCALLRIRRRSGGEVREGFPRYICLEGAVQRNSTVLVRISDTVRVDGEGNTPGIPLLSRSPCSTLRKANGIARSRG